MSKKFFVLLLISLGVGISVGYFKSKLTAVNSVVDTKEDILENLSGTLYFALAPESTLITDIHTLDLKSGQIDNIFLDNEVKFSPRLSNDKRYVAYTSAPVDHSSLLRFPHTEHLQIHVYDTLTKTTEKISTTTEAFRKKKPRWSPDDRYILYHGYSAEAYYSNMSPREPDNWIIYLYDTVTKKTEEITTGTESEWTPDGKYFYYLKNGGLYVFELATRNPTKLIEVVNPKGEAKANIGMTLSLSSDGKFLAWASAGASTLIIYDTNFSYTVRPNIVHQLKLPKGTSVVHPVFSPDNRFLAVQETELNTKLYEDGIKIPSNPKELLSLPAYDLLNPRFTVYELETFRSKKVFDLTGVDFNGTSLAQWVY